MTKCLGCGIDCTKDYCERCFKIKNYNTYIKRDISVSSEVLTGYHVLVLDALFLPNNIDSADLIVINKRDLVPDISDERLINYINKISGNSNIIVISTYNNYHLDELYECLKNKGSIYFTGSTKSGKTALINKLLYDYAGINNTSIVSNIPNITYANMTFKLHNITITDTPSNVCNTIINYVDNKSIKEITPQNMKQTVYKVKDSIFNIHDLISVSTNSSYIIFYFNDQVNIKRSNNMLELKEYNFKLKDTEQLVIDGMGYIKITDSGSITLNTIPDINIYVRDDIE